ncbi:hypothetical protein ETD83_10895 [Actinomadura soli]|uniref:Uncharacterized protein n=1 Tax=Actinomadura soli TaxID=2508997 RepID=A0A5C4JF32_9ACTN|nr:hypothetical protein [Actinomadura soli]TMR03405.1 hypothetical protein ETD83_10895 [Actinomadura soli]
MPEAPPSDPSSRDELARPGPHSAAPPAERPGAPGPEPLWGLGQIATYLGCGKETVRGWWQAARARAADPTAAAAADALPPPNFLIPNDPGGIAGFFAPPTPGPAVPAALPWWTVERVRPLWRPPVIVAWALTTGRTTTDGAPGWERLPIPMFADLPALPAALPRVLDAVVQLPPRRPGGGRAFTVHLRIWEGPLPSGPGADPTPPRTVVLLSPADGPPPPLPHAEDLAARILAAGHLTARQARRALWFLQGEQLPESQPDGAVALRTPVHYLSFAVQPAGDDEPDDSSADGPTTDAPPTPAGLGHRGAVALERRLDGAPAGPLRSPRLLPAALEHIDHLVGERVEVYPEGTCTADTIARYAAGPRPVPLAWDPAELAADLAHLPILAAAHPTGAPATADTAGATGAEAYRAAVYRAAAHWVAAHAEQSRREYRLALPGLDRDAVHRQPPQIEPELNELLENVLADTEEHPYGIGILLRDLTAVRHLLTPPGHQHADPADDVADDVADDRTPVPDPQDALAAALRHAADRIGRQYHQVAAYIAEHHALPARLPDGSSPRPDPDAGNQEPATYLDTVSWWGPKAEDRDAARLLAGLFFDHERATGLRHGYDPFGRPVVHCAAARAFAVQWPTATAPAADQPITHVYRPLPDGRVDLIPLGDQRHPL